MQQTNYSTVQSAKSKGSKHQRNIRNVTQGSFAFMAVPRLLMFHGYFLVTHGNKTFQVNSRPESHAGSRGKTLMNSKEYNPACFFPNEPSADGCVCKQALCVVDSPERLFLCVHLMMMNASSGTIDPDGRKAEIIMIIMVLCKSCN